MGSQLNDLTDGHGFTQLTGMFAPIAMRSRLSESDGQVSLKEGKRRWEILHALQASITAISLFLRMALKNNLCLMSATLSWILIPIIKVRDDASSRPEAYERRCRSRPMPTVRLVEPETDRNNNQKE